jgi:Na+/H+-dicarboxylate symporter
MSAFHTAVESRKAGEIGRRPMIAYVLVGLLSILIFLCISDVVNLGRPGSR